MAEGAIKKVAFDFKSGILLTRDAPSTVLPQNAKIAVVCVYIDSTFSKTVDIYIPLKMLTANEKYFNGGYFFINSNCGAVSVKAKQVSDGYNIAFDAAYVNGSALDLQAKAIVFYL